MRERTRAASGRVLLAALDAVRECRASLDRNGAPELQLERLLLSIATSLYVRSAA